MSTSLQRSHAFTTASAFELKMAAFINVFKFVAGALTTPPRGNFTNDHPGVEIMVNGQIMVVGGLEMTRRLTVLTLHENQIHEHFKPKQCQVNNRPIVMDKTSDGHDINLVHVMAVDEVGWPANFADGTFGRLVIQAPFPTEEERDEYIYKCQLLVERLSGNSQSVDGRVRVE